ncbi:hypothetical protein V6N13_118532 [Hibiscus sabdariffa]
MDLLFGYLLWLLWNRRNARVFDSDYASRESILVQGKRLLHECLSSRNNPGAQSLQVIPPPRDHVRWEAPPSGWYKLNSDGAVKGHWAWPLVGVWFGQNMGF